MTNDALRSDGPLAGVRVLDLTWVLAGPYAGMLLADLGAEVIKVERPPYGDVARTMPPFAADVSAIFGAVNRGKRSVLLDLDAEAGRELLLRLVEHADVLIESFTPGRMDAWGLGYAALAGRNDGLIYASLSGFGQTGPERERPAFDIVVQALSGLMSVTGAPDGPPARAGLPLGDLGAGLFAALGVLAALHERERSGRGQHLDVAMLDCQVALLQEAFASYFATGATPGRHGSAHPTATPWQAFDSADGQIVVALSFNVENSWGVFCALVGRPELIDDPRFVTAAARSRNRDELTPLLSTTLRTRPSAYWLAELGAAGIACAPVLTVPEAASLPQLAARELFVDIEGTNGATQRVVGPPLKLSRTPAGVAGPAPAPGAHTRAVLADVLGLTQAEVEAAFASGGVGEGRTLPPAAIEG